MKRDMMVDNKMLSDASIAEMMRKETMMMDADSAMASNMKRNNMKDAHQAADTKYDTYGDYGDYANYGSYPGGGESEAAKMAMAKAEM